MKGMSLCSPELLVTTELLGTETWTGLFRSVMEMSNACAHMHATPSCKSWAELLPSTM